MSPSAGGSWALQLYNVGSDVGPTKLGHKEDSVVSSQTASDQSKADAEAEGLSWTFSNESIGWSISSRSLLSVTYRSAQEGLASYTNISSASDFLHRSLTLSSGGRDEFDDTGPCFGAGGCGCCRTYSRCLQKIGLGPRPVKIYKEVYTSSDIVHTELIDEVTVRGMPACKALKVYLKPKVNKRERMETASASVSSDLKVKETDTSYLGGSATEDDIYFSDSSPVDSLGDEVWINGKANGEGSNSKSAVHGPVITFALPKVTDTSASTADCLPLLWKVSLPPDPSICIETLTIFDGTLDIGCGNNSDVTESEPTAVYINGYQSWSYAGTVRKGQVQPASAMPHVLSRAFNRGATVPPRATHSIRSDIIPEHSWDDNDADSDSTPLVTGDSGSGEDDRDDDLDDADLHYYKSDQYACITCQPGEVQERNDVPFSSLIADNGPALIVGSLSQRRQFSLITLCPDLRDISMQCSLDGVIPTRREGIESDWAYAQIIPGNCYDDEPTAHYINAVAAHNKARPLQHGVLLTGWCSWYHYYENIEESMLRQTFETLSKLKPKIDNNLALIDDGYMTAWGDWGSLKPKAFPSAFRLGPNPTEKEVDDCMKGLSDAIRVCGMKPGIWLAPYAADKHSKLAKKRPEWIIRDNSGRAANSSNCGKYFYGLDATNPEVREHVFNTIKRATAVWGFDVLKLDFLYAAVLKGNGKSDLSLSRAQTMDLALRTLRAAAGPNTFIIGCGCPLGPAVGYIDGMRISADTGPTYRPSFPLPSWDHSTLPSLRAMIRNSITRLPLSHRWWHNDPDCLLLGETTDLTDEEVISAATVIGMTGGMLLMSDDLSQLRYNRLRIITRIFPSTGAAAVSLDLHRSSHTGIPFLLKIWCDDSSDSGDASNNILAVKTAQSVAFHPDRLPFDGIRNRLSVASGLGTWSVVSISNWDDVPKTMAAPFPLFLPPPPEKAKNKAGGAETAVGFHCLAFWSSKYMWLPKQDINSRERTLSKRLDPRETEVFHVKHMSNPKDPQYIGSDMHFTCGYEVSFFTVSPSENRVDVGFKTYVKRSGYVFIYLPTLNDKKIKVTVNGKDDEFAVIASPSCDSDGTLGKVVKLFVSIRANGKSDKDGLVTLFY